MEPQEKYLSRCIRIAAIGLGTTAPNPMVGAVIVHGERIIGEGFTSPFGGPHAEVNAIRSVERPELLREATLYVTLEPCCHHGKTPPCTDLILESGIPRVVVGIRDPHKKVSGQGIDRLRQAGCEVLTGILESECREHHRRFLTFHEKKRPYVILKWAQSPDGFMAPEPQRRKTAPEPFWISGRRSRQLVHKWRTEEAAILVGWQTVVQDNPRLDSRHWEGANPIRILLDPGGRASAGLNLLDGTLPTLRFCRAGTRALVGVEDVVQPEGADLKDFVLEELHRRGILSVIVEGGGRTLRAFLESGQWDEARVFEGVSPLGGGLAAPRPGGRLSESRTVGPDLLRIWRND